MKTYTADKIRNVALLGHSNSGKTTLTEAILYSLGITNRQGKVTDGNTVSDFDKEEIAREISIGTSVIPVEWNDIKYNILDTPGYFDFIGEMYGAKRASESSVLVVDAQSGVEVGTEKSWKNLEKYTTPRVVFLNKMDKENVDFKKILSELRSKLGDNVIPLSIPIGSAGNFKGYIDILDSKAYEYDGKDYKEIPLTEDQRLEIGEIKEALDEKIAETDDVLLDKYFSGKPYTKEELDRGIKQSVSNGDLAPLVVGCAEKSMGCEFLLDIIGKYMPSPLEIGPYLGEYDGEEIERNVDLGESFSATVFKTIVDPFVGKLTLFKVISGKLTRDVELYNPTKDETEKIGGLYYLRGKDQINTDEIVAGDIGATSKLNHTQTGDTICDKSNQIKYETIEYPEPNYFQAVEAKKEGEDEKVGVSLNRLADEDPSIAIERNSETKQLLIGGLGNMQLDVLVNKLKNRFDVEVNLLKPIIAYRETIKGSASVQGRHKKQSGGAGQYGDVHIRFEPSDEEFEFAQEIFGGSVPRNYWPAVEKGIRESMERGVLSGYPVVNLKATLYDGSYHDVDSNEMSFKLAAILAFKKGMQEAKPVLLEPIMEVEVIIPDDYLGDIIGDVNKRRGRILGMDQQNDGSQKIIAEAPHGEMFEYAIDLRAMTQARGDFKMKFVRYEEVPSNIAEKVIAQAKIDKER